MKTTVRICTRIPAEWSEVVKEYNKTAPRQFVFSHAMYLALEKEIEQIKKEMSEGDIK